MHHRKLTSKSWTMSSLPIIVKTDRGEVVQTKSASKTRSPNILCKRNYSQSSSMFSHAQPCESFLQQFSLWKSLKVTCALESGSENPSEKCINEIGKVFPAADNAPINSSECHIIKRGINQRITGSTCPKP